jgi:DNA-binding CsgD family transcriptional regulator
MHSNTAALSPREREIATLAAAGQPSKVIAQRLGLSVRTVSNHLQNAYLKLGISGRDDLAAALDASQ